jgi:hypothetical protein
LLAIINETRSRVNTLESKENVLLTATQTLTTKTLTTPTVADLTNAQHAHTGAASGGTIAHTSLTALTTGDPHTQYALLAGRSGGQSLSGGTAENDDLTLQGTTNATRTTSYVIMQPNGGNVGIETTSPKGLLHLGTTTSQINISTGYKQIFAGGFTLMFRESRDIYLASNTYYGSSGQWFNTYANFGSVVVSMLEGFFTISTAPSQVSENTALTIKERFRVQENGNVGIGTDNPSTRLDIDNGALELAEMTAPGAGAANTVRIYAVDNGSGKTQLMAIFNTGAAQQLAIQP